MNLLDEYDLNRIMFRVMLCTRASGRLVADVEGHSDGKCKLRKYLARGRAADA